MRNINIIPLVASLLLLAGCNNFFDTEIDLPGTEHDPILAVNCYLSNTEDSLLTARISRTYGLFEQRPNEDFVNDATVEMYKNGDLYRTFVNNPSFFSTNYEAETGGPIGDPGDEFEIVVSHPELGTARASQIIPEPVPLTEVSARILSFAEFEGSTGEIRLTIDDPAGEENFYELAATQLCIFEYQDYDGTIFRDTFEQPVFFDGEFDNDPNTEQSVAFENLLISDRNFNGQNFTLSLPVFLCYSEEPIEEEDLNFRIFWRTVTKDYYQYFTSINESQNAQGNPFSEPVSVYSNMENGVGAFCASSQLIYTIGE